MRSMQAVSVVVSRQGDQWVIVFENSAQQAAVRVDRSLLGHLGRQVTRELETWQRQHEAGPDLSP